MKTIGTDVSLEVCRNEGYTMIQFDARKKFNSKSGYRVFAHLPKYAREGYVGEKTIMYDTETTFEEMKEHYLENKDGFNSFSETNIHVDFDNPSHYDFLNLASDLMAYGGYFDPCI
jgi:hypothetical protein